MTNKNKQIELFEKIVNNQRYTTIWLVIILGLVILLFGGLFNNFAISSNNGKMPIYANPIFYTDSKVHFVTDNWEEINEPILCDIIHIYRYYLSIGDILLGLGFIIVIYGMISFIHFRIKFRKAKLIYN